MRRKLIVLLALSLSGHLVVVGFLLYRRWSTHVSAYDVYRDERRQMLSDMPPVPRSIVLAGDSLTDRGEWSELLSSGHVVNRGISGDTLNDVLDRLDSLTVGTPVQLFMMIGINDLSRGASADSVLQLYEQLLQRLTGALPNTRVFVQSVLPVHPMYSGLANNQTIGVVNARLETLSRSYGCQYLDVFSAMSDSTGQLDARFTSDGLHLSGAGYVQWGRFLAPYIARDPSPTP